MGTRSRSGATRPISYRALAQGQDKPKEHSSIVESQSSSSSGERAVYSFVAKTLEEIAQQLALQAQAHQKQLRAQAQSNDLLKKMLQQVHDQVSKKNPSMLA